MVRDFDNVWEEICFKAEGFMQSQEPIYSLGQKIGQYVTKVTDKGIYVLPDHPRSKKAARIPKEHFALLWEGLMNDGQAGYDLGNVPGNVYYVAYALLAVFIEGIGTQSRPTTLFFTEKSAATRQFAGDKAFVE